MMVAGDEGILLGQPKLRTVGPAPSATPTIHHLNSIPEDVIRRVGREIIKHKLLGMGDVTGDDWTRIWAVGVQGAALVVPVNIEDVVLGNTGWSAKTLWGNGRGMIRLISGRNSVSCSYSIDNPFKNIERTGEAVLRIWNARAQHARERHPDLRTAVLIRDKKKPGRFTLFEKVTETYDPNEFVWKANKGGNLEGFDASENHCFTWQPHGAQFTIIAKVPKSKVILDLHIPEAVDGEAMLVQAGFDDDWISFDRADGEALPTKRRGEQPVIEPVKSLPLISIATGNDANSNAMEEGTAS
jgi:hypothetical protein